MLPKISIQNVVSTFKVNKDNTNMPLSELAMKVPFAEFNSKRFAAAVIRLRHPRTTCLFFGSGKAVCTGATTVEESYQGAEEHIKLLQQANIDVKLIDFKVQNIVNTSNCGFALDLVAFANSMDGIISYEPDLFPGLTYRVRVHEQEDYWIVFLLFQSGKCVITGARQQEHAINAWRNFFFNTIMPFKAKHNCGSSGCYRVCQRIAHNANRKPVAEIAMKFSNRKKRNMNAKEFLQNETKAIEQFKMNQTLEEFYSAVTQGNAFSTTSAKFTTLRKKRKVVRL